MIDTHAHLQFKAFQGKVDQVIKSANDAGVEKIIAVGTNLETSKKAVELVEKYEGLYASVGTHPHHVFEYLKNEIATSSASRRTPRNDVFARSRSDEAISGLELLISHPKVVAIGETGIDRHIYENTKYRNYKITEEFIELQKLFFKKQIRLAIKHKKSLIIHNREAVPELLEILEANWDSFLEYRSVFHCCEPDHRLLEFATLHNVYIGIDGDITYNLEKQEFMKKIPLELLVLETDSPYFVPEPLKSADIVLNEPRNLKYIAEFISRLKNEPIENVRMLSSKNALALLRL